MIHVGGSNYNLESGELLRILKKKKKLLREVFLIAYM